MANGESVPFDVFFEDRAQEFIDGLSASGYDRLMVAIGLLLIDPYPGERAKVRLPFPFRYGTIAYLRDGFFVVYEFENAATIRVSTISWHTGQYWGQPDA